jgi:hypothetical protein
MESNKSNPNEPEVRKTAEEDGSLAVSELDKVAGGIAVGRTGDPCEGGEVHSR